MKKLLGKSDSIYLPVTPGQFEVLTNEILGELNTLADSAGDQGFSGDYAAQVLMSAIHALDHKIGQISKKALLFACVNRISCHVTYEASKEIQARLQSQLKPDGITDDTDPGDPAALSAVSASH